MAAALDADPVRVHGPLLDQHVQRRDAVAHVLVPRLARQRRQVAVPEASRAPEGRVENPKAREQKVPATPQAQTI